MRISNSLVIISILPCDFNLSISISQVFHDCSRLFKISFQVSSFSNLVISSSGFLFDKFSMIKDFLLNFFVFIKNINEIGWICSFFTKCIE